jgi:diacylglycerol kinase (ATP)
VHTPSIIVVVNPERRELLASLLEALGDQPCVEVVEPDEPEDLADALHRAATSADIVAAVGGDGTQRTAVDALKGTSASLAVVPAGTANLFARVLGIDGVDAAASAMVGGARRTLDTGVVDGDTFILNASSGFDASVMRRVDDSAKRWGRLGYFVTGLRTLSGHRPRVVEISVDGDVFFEGRAMTVMVTNVGQRGSEALTVAPDSSPDDGLLDVVVQRCDSVATMARTIWTLWRGRNPRSQDLLVGHGRTVDVRWAEQVEAQRDGDATGPVTESHHRVDASSVTVCVPVTS